MGVPNIAGISLCAIMTGGNDKQWAPNIAGISLCAIMTGENNKQWAPLNNNDSVLLLVTRTHIHTHARARTHARTYIRSHGEHNKTVTIAYNFTNVLVFSNGVAAQKAISLVTDDLVCLRACTLWLSLECSWLTTTLRNISLRALRED